MPKYSDNAEGGGDIKFDFSDPAIGVMILLTGVVLSFIIVNRDLIFKKK